LKVDVWLPKLQQLNVDVLIVKVSAFHFDTEIICTKQIKPFWSSQQKISTFFLFLSVLVGFLWEAIGMKLGWLSNTDLNKLPKTSSSWAQSFGKWGSLSPTILASPLQSLWAIRGAAKNEM